MSYMDRLKAKISETRYPDQLTKLPKPGSVSFGSEPSRHISEKLLPPDLLAGLDRLRTMRPPRISNPTCWPEIIADAQRLANEGWAHQALALGWEPLQIFGWSPERDGVAVWLAGGVPMFTAESCTVRIGAGAYRCMDRRPMPGAVLLWELGQ